MNFFIGTFLGGGFFGERVVGGYHDYGHARRPKDEIARSREYFGLLNRAKRAQQDEQNEVAAIIADVAARQARRPEQNEQNRFRELRRELRLKGIKAEAWHFEALNAERDRRGDNGSRSER